MGLIKYSFRALIIYGFFTVVFVVFTIHYLGMFDHSSVISFKNAVSYPRLKYLINDIDQFFWFEMNLSQIITETDNSKRSILTTYNKVYDKNDVYNYEKPKDFCPENPPELEGWMSMPDHWKAQPPTLEESRKSTRLNKAAGNFTYSPLTCTARYTVAIIIPYRGREKQLQWFVSHMHKVWRRQQIRYTLYVVEQMGNQLFNRAKLMNVGFLEAQKEYRYDCYVFHDVDLLLENDKCLYWCAKNDEMWPNPRHISTYIDKFSYSVHTYNLGMCSPMSYKDVKIELFGGVTMFTEEQFITMNGFSNVYWGWGGEDDDLFLRSIQKGYKVDHEVSHRCSYHMLEHKHERRNRKNTLRYLLLKHALSRQEVDGLKNLQYDVLKREQSSIYTLIKTDIGRPPRKLREMMKMFEGDESLPDKTCLESLIWMYNKFNNI